VQDSGNQELNHEHGKATHRSKSLTLTCVKILALSLASQVRQLATLTV